MAAWKVIVQSNMTKILESEEDKERRFHAAANDNNLVDLERLLQGSVNVNCRADMAKWTALHAASSNGHVDCIKKLLKYRATIDAPDEFGSTPLFYAVMNSHREAVKLLLSCGASLRIRNKWGETAMDLTRKDFLTRSPREDDNVANKFSDVVPVEEDAVETAENDFGRGGGGEFVFEDDLVTSFSVVERVTPRSSSSHMSPSSPRSAGAPKKCGGLPRGDFKMKAFGDAKFESFSSVDYNSPRLSPPNGATPR